MQGVKLSRVLDAARVSRSAKQARANLSRLRGELKGMVERHEPPEKVNAFEADGRLAVARALREGHAVERAALQAELEAERGRWEAAYMKEYAVHAFLLQNAERRIRAMSDQELQAASYAVSTGGQTAPDDPHELDILVGEARARALRVKDDSSKGELVALSDILGKRIEAKGLRRVWERTEVGIDLMKQIRLTDDVSGSGVMAVDSQGRWFAQSMNDLWTMELEKEEAASE